MSGPPGPYMPPSAGGMSGPNGPHMGPMGTQQPGMSPGGMMMPGTGLAPPAGFSGAPMRPPAGPQQGGPMPMMMGGGPMQGMPGLGPGSMRPGFPPGGMMQHPGPGGIRLPLPGQTGPMSAPPGVSMSGGGTAPQMAMGPGGQAPGGPMGMRPPMGMNLGGPGGPPGSAVGGMPGSMGPQQPGSGFMGMPRPGSLAGPPGGGMQPYREPQPGGNRPPGAPGMMQQPGQPGMMQQPGQPGMMQQQGQPGMMQQPGQPGMAQQPGQPGMMQQPGQPGMAQHFSMGHQAGPPGMMQQPGQPGMMHPGMPPPPMGMMGGPPAPGGMMPPPGPPGYGGGAGGAPPGYDPHGAQRLVENFESLTLGPGGAILGPGGVQQQQEGLDPGQLPRPTGPAAATAMDAQPPCDPGNCSPDCMRLTVSGIPNSTALRARWAMPVGVVVHPMADEARGRAVPLINLGGAGIIRCRKCRTYMNPFVQWTDSGRRFRCNVCGMLNEIPVEYFCNLDQNGRRRDLEERPELSRGTVEYVAPAEYMVRAPMPPVYFFAIDVTHAAAASGSLAATCHAIKASLDGLPGDERTMVGFLTFDSTLHFYNLKAGLAQPQMLVVTEVDEPFVPLPDDLLVNLVESRSVVDALLEALPNNFATTSCVDSATGPALQAAFMVMAHLGGKLLLFQTSVPSVGIGKVKPLGRDNPQLYNTDREAAMRSPEDAFYKRYAAECSRVQIGVDVFAFGGQFMDLASLAAIPRYTCGEVYYYPAFSIARDEAKLLHEVHHNLTRPTAWEAVMRVRCSKGLKIATFHGHFHNRSSDLLALPVCDPDKSFAVQIAHEENIVAGPVAYVQCALLYTSSNGERRIRVHSMAVPVVSELADMYNGADAAGLACMTAKMAVEKCLTSRLEETRQMVQTKVVALFKEFRIMNASSLRQSNKLIYPPSLRLLPLWTLGLLRCSALRGGGKDVSADERMATIHWVMESSVPELCRLLYPTLYPVHDPAGPWGTLDAEGRVQLPQPAPASLPLLSEAGVYLVDNGRVFMLWVGRMVAREWAVEVFGGDPQTMDPMQLSVEPSRGSPLSERLNRMLSSLRSKRSLYQQCLVVRQGSPMEAHLLPFLVEDRMPSASSYADFMHALHKAVLSK